MKLFIRNLTYFFSILSKSKINVHVYLIVYVFVGLVIPLANIMFPKIVIGVFIGGLSWFSSISIKAIQVLIVIFIFFIITTLAQSIKAYIDKKNNWFTPYLQFKLREGIQIRAMMMDFPKTEDKGILNKYYNAEYASSLGERIFGNISGILTSFILFIVYGILVSRLHPALLLLMTVNAGIGYFLIMKAKVYDASFREPRAEIDRNKNYLFQTMFDYTFGKETRLFSLYNLLSAKFIEQQTKKRILKTKTENKMLLLSVVDLLFTFFREAVVYGLLLWLFWNEKLTVDNFVMYIGLMASFSVITKGMSSDLSSLAETNVYLTDYHEFTQKTEEDTGGLSVDKLSEYTIEFRNVTFAYPGQSNPVLHDISFCLGHGKHTALVGLNGAGKTTIVKLICRLYEPNEGEILLNGVNINRYNKADFYKHIAPVFQDSKLYAFSVKENITLTENGDTDRMWSILQDLDIADKIKVLSNAENTQVLKNMYDNGVEFSEGEKQRLCIARAMYKGGGILLLDEPTAALDAIAEKRIYEGFSKLSKGRTTLFISHRLNSNRFCDNIIFLENGRIIAQGRHETLLAQCRSYCDLYKMQAQYYVDVEQEGEAI